VLTVTGPAQQVATSGAAHGLPHTESTAGQSRAVVRTRTATASRDATDLGLTVERATIQQLVVGTSLAASPAATACTGDHTDLQGAPR